MHRQSRECCSKHPLSLAARVSCLPDAQDAGAVVRIIRKHYPTEAANGVGHPPIEARLIGREQSKPRVRHACHAQQSARIGHAGSSEHDDREANVRGKSIGRAAKVPLNKCLVERLICRRRGNERRLLGDERHGGRRDTLVETLALRLLIHLLLGSARVVNQSQLAPELFAPELEQIVGEDVDPRRALHETADDARHSLDRGPETEDGTHSKSTGPGHLGRTTKEKLL
eukprot:4882584-Prymnesium_polylepis.2